MRSITAKGIQKSFGGKVVLSDVNLTLSEGRRLGLIGENGSGKTTLLKIISARLKTDSGRLLGLEHRCTYIAQDFSGVDNETLHQFLVARAADMRRAQRLLKEAGLNLGEDEKRLHRVRCGDLSGGERKKLEIVAGLTSGSLFLAMDEPENHLDYQTIEWLIGTLHKFRGGLLFVSHDQFFIDQLADTILELADGILTSYSMTYDEYLAEKERQISAQARDWTVEKKSIARLRTTVQMMKVRAQRSANTAAVYRQTKRRLEELKTKHGKKPAAETVKPHIRFGGVDQKKGKLIVRVDDLSFAYETHKVFSGATAELRFGEKVVLFGPNGSGKSTLLRLITSELEPQRGSARIGVNVKWELLTQDHLSGVDATQSSLHIFQTALKWPENKCRACLAQYGIKVDLVTQPLQVLSGGQQARFKLALIFAQEPEFLILDEPTNHVDPLTWEAIVDAIHQYSGTILAITHDREFIDAIAETLWVIKDKKIFSEPGNLSDYLARKR